ncbi:MAG: TlpA disulfide reductase family protein [Candidatus Pedobacter colombiensis]|uniref:TlpA disulfide reductase family protein n=1 Tax=Candidatus Pedobacter colombiensis TaxID=3121371 RepID=A0AAJ5W5M2_9SPHI|nr:TlpA disulfide reductase family protein [Pedobacter sp.]WEK17575.1 MAG: TlpA disulfide reductase family protein [Pedobacter sp.]
MMKRISYILLLCVVFAACKDKANFVIEGQFKNATPGSKVYLFGLQKDHALPLDSTVFSEKGEFKFTHSTPAVDFFRISSGNSEYMIIAKNGDHIKINADLADKTLAYNISGAMEADKLEELNKVKNQYMVKISEIQKKFDEAVVAQPDKRDVIMEQLRPAYTQEVDGLNKAVLKFAQDNTSSLASFYAVNLLNPGEYEKELVDYSDKIKNNFNNNPAVTEFLVRMSKLKTVQIGQPAPEFTINGIDGKPIKLSDFKGKYVMLDFWASWCTPCRQENPNVVKAYNTYKDKNFTILGISLDKDATAWKSAVAADKLTWAQASDLKDFESPTAMLYAIEAIPSSYIIDPSGKIIAKNLRGEELDAFLSKTLR